MKLLMILSRIPYPLDKGDKLRAYHQIKHLLEQNVELTICCLHFEKIKANEIAHLQSLGGKWHFISLSYWRAASQIGYHLFTRRPFQVALFYQSKAHREVQKMIAEEQPDHIWVQLVRTAEYAKQAVHIKKSIDYMDALGSGVAKRANQTRGLQRLFWKEEAERLTRYENIIWNYFDHHFIISEKDAQQINAPQPKLWKILSNGIDFDYFQRQSKHLGKKIVFIGNMAYPPNIDAALYLAKEIMPLVWEKNPRIPLLIAGADPVSAIQQLVSSQIIILGRQDDIRKAYEEAAIFVAPMRLGTGMQNKILEALCMEIPVITSPVAAEAFDLPIKKHLITANNPHEMAEAILQTYPHAELPLAENRNIVALNHNWKNIIQTLIQTIDAQD
jgi:polysaccharide biosynthesis protein PslH